ncbi:MAG: glycosyltransferase 87 family protein [Acidobacteriaceae bacterium]
MAVLLTLLVAATLWYVHMLNRQIPGQRSGLLPRWIGTRAALQGHDPYSPEVLRQIQTAFYGHPLHPADRMNPEAFFYPAPLVLLLAPLAPLSWEGARLAFLWTVGPLLALSFWLCIRTLRIRVGTAAQMALLALAFFSWPSIWGLRLLQLTAPVAALIFISWFLIARGRQVVPGVLLALITIKPQLVLPVLVWLFLWSLLRQRWKLIGAFAATEALLLSATQLVVPGWFGHWLASLHNYTGVTQTAIPLEHLLGHWLGLALTLILAGSCAAILWKLRRANADSPEFGHAMSLILATTVCLVPTNPPLIYNYVLLVPGCLVLAFPPHDGVVASVMRVLALAQLGLDCAAITLAALADILGHPVAVLSLLPFLDYLLPPLVAGALLVRLMLPLGAAQSSPAEVIAQATVAA